MAIDPVAIASVVTAAGTVASSYFGVYFQRIRQKLRREEPALVEEAAVEAASKAILEPPISEAQAPGQPVSVVASKDEMLAVVREAVGEQLQKSEKRNRRAEFKAGMFFFVAGILATITITLYVHPGG